MFLSIISIDKMIRLLQNRFAILTLSSIFFMSLSLKADYSPTNCNAGNNTPWEGPITLTGSELPDGVIDCDDDDCEVQVKYYKRMIFNNGNPYWEFQILSVQYKNCSASCRLDPWKVGLWFIAMNERYNMGLIYVGDCYNTFTYKVGSCWELTNPFSQIYKYTVCGGECCQAVYRICIVATTGDDNFEFDRLGEPSIISNNCTGPCQFYDCGNTTPNDFTVTTVKNGPPISVSLNKMSVNELDESVSMQIQPNPTNGKIKLTLNMPEKGTYLITVYDSRGDEMLKQDLIIASEKDVEVDLNSDILSVGMYNIIITGKSGEIMSGKFIKMK